MTWNPGKFVWFEHVSKDVAAACRYYQDLFGWHIEAMDMGPAGSYHLIQNATEGIGGFRTAMPGVPSHWMSYLSVADVDASCTAAIQAGAKLLMPPSDFPTVGRGATIVDPTGAAFSLWKNLHGDRPELPETAVGDWCWNELMSSDVKAALAFYESVFAYTHEAKEMGPDFTYYLLKTGPTPRAGLMQTPQQGLPSVWQPYIRVVNCDASTARARQLGSQVLVEPMDVPNVGRFSLFLDPQGASIGVLQFAPM